MTAICPHCGFDLVRDAPLAMGRYEHDSRVGLSIDGQRLRMPKQCHEIAGAVFRAQGRLLPYSTLAERLGSESWDLNGWISVQMNRIRKGFADAGLPCPIERVFGQGLQWSGAPHGDWPGWTGGRRARGRKGN